MPVAKDMLRSFVAEKVASLRNAPHVQSLLESHDDNGRRPHDEELFPLAPSRSRNGKHRRASFSSAHISSPNGVETTLGCEAADRAVVVGPGCWRLNCDKGTV